MLHRFLCLALLFAGCFGTFQVFSQKAINTNRLPVRIAFGSCGHQNRPQPVLDIARAKNPDLFVFLGDNIYGDTDEMDTLRAKYARWAAQPPFQRLKQQVPLLATWDDHDFGRNDAGRHYPFKAASKEIFLDFFHEPANSPRRQREGIYTSYYFKEKGKTLQLILLDNRTFRDDLKPYNQEVAKDKRYFYELDYAVHTSTDSTLLGEAQWQWLEGELKKPADLRIIGSGSQFSIEYNGYEAWANFPHEQKRMLELIQKTRANGVMFLTGDVHYAEISKLTYPGLYPIYDVTSSGITSTWHFPTPNANRIEGPIMENHIGLLTIDWFAKRPTVRMEIWDVRGNQRIEHTIPFTELTLPK